MPMPLAEPLVPVYHKANQGQGVRARQTASGDGRRETCCSRMLRFLGHPALRIEFEKSSLTAANATNVY